MFTPDRNEARAFMIGAWRKFRAGEPLTGMEKIVTGVLVMHPEYHALFDDPDTLDRDYTPESGSLNPFLHVSLHLAIEEQLSIDQPPGIRARYDALLANTGDEHEAKHALLECLGEMLWEAQRLQRAPDPAGYFACLDRRLGVSRQ
jgi:hypothetical protein